MRSIHQTLTTAAAHIAGSIPVVRRYDMEGQLCLVVSRETLSSPRNYELNGSLSLLSDERIYERELNAAGIACCAC